MACLLGFDGHLGCATKLDCRPTGSQEMTNISAREAQVDLAREAHLSQPAGRPQRQAISAAMNQSGGH